MEQRPPKSIRLTAENEMTFRALQHELGLDNSNKTINYIIENFWKYLNYRRKIKLIEDLIREFKD